LWGNEVGIQCDESLFDAIKSSSRLTSAGAWYTLTMENGYTKKFQPSKWGELMKSDPEFRQHIYNIVDEEVVQKFDKRQGEASTYYEDPDDLTVPLKNE
jgi:hypothetical protein